MGTESESDKKVFLSWSSFCTRSQNQAKHFGAKLIRVVYLDSHKSIPMLMLRYLVSFIMTLVVLVRERPRVVFTENQPPFLILAVYLYSKLFGAKYILDSHSGAFNNKKWAWALPLYRFVSSRAFININTNEYHKGIVESWGGRSTIVGDVPVDHDRSYEPYGVNENSIAIVASFAFDEPVEEIWKAAEMCPDVSLYITGKATKLPEALREHVPSNVVLVGFLPDDVYLGLLSSVKAVMVLTTRDHTMQRGAYEALSLEQPIITSKWDVLKDSFGDSAVYVENEAEAIAHGVHEMLENHETFKHAAVEQRKVRREFFEKVRDQILSDLAMV